MHIIAFLLIMCFSKNRFLSRLQQLFYYKRCYKPRRRGSNIGQNTYRQSHHKKFDVFMRIYVCVNVKWDHWEPELGNIYLSMALLNEG